MDHRATPTPKAVFSDTPPPSPPRHFTPLVSCKPGHKNSFIVTSERPISTYTHFRDGTTYPCPGKLGCPFCARRISPRWKAFVSGISTTSGVHCVVELTTNAVQCVPALKDTTTKIRGMLLTLERRGSSARSPVIARLDVPAGTAAQIRLKPPLNIEAVLCDIWGNPWQKLSFEGEDGYAMPSSDLFDMPGEPHGSN